MIPLNQLSVQALQRWVDADPQVRRFDLRYHGLWAPPETEGAAPRGGWGVVLKSTRGKRQADIEHVSSSFSGAVTAALMGWEKRRKAKK